MTIHRSTRARSALATLVCLSTFAVGCSSPAGTEPSTGEPSPAASAPAASAQATPYDGETVFRGVFLGSGPVADRLPELTDAKAAMDSASLSKEDIAKYLEGASDRMRTAPDTTDDADKFATVAADLRSGKLAPEDMVKARRDYQATSADAIVTRISAADPTFFKRFAVEMQSGDQVRVSRAFEDGAGRFMDAASVLGALPGHVVPEAKCLVVLLAVAWVTVYYKAYFWDQSEHPQGALHRDELVQTMTSRLAAAQ